MGWGWKAALGSINPVAAIANFGSGIADYLGAEQDRRATDQYRNDQNSLAIQNMQMQREFAQQGIRWRVADAEAAGLHPLAALGASGASYSPVQQVGMPASRGDSTRSVGKMGQDISRSIMAMATPEEKTFKLLQLQKLRTENLILETELRERTKNLMDGPTKGLPSNAELPALTGQGDSYIQEQPLRSTHRQPGAPHQDVGHIADTAFARTASGGLAIVPSKDVKERIEDQFVPEMAWALRNYARPNLGVYPRPDPRYYPLPKGYDYWGWSVPFQEYQPKKYRQGLSKHHTWGQARDSLKGGF